jgi:hypothetical protein
MKVSPYVSANADYRLEHRVFSRTSSSHLALEKSPAPFFTGGIFGALILALLRLVGLS